MKIWIKRTIMGAVVFALVLGGAFFGIKTSDNAIFAGNAEVETQSPAENQAGGDISLLSTDGEDADTELKSPESQAGADSGDQSAAGQAEADSGSGGNSVDGDQSTAGDQAGVNGGDQSAAEDQAGVFTGDGDKNVADSQSGVDADIEDGGNSTDAEKDSQNPAEDASELDAAEGENADESNPVNNSQNPEDQMGIDAGDGDKNVADSQSGVDADTGDGAGDSDKNVEDGQSGVDADTGDGVGGGDNSAVTGIEDTRDRATFATVEEVLNNNVNDSEPEKQNLLEKDAQESVETDLTALISKVNLYAVRTYAGTGDGSSAANAIDMANTELGSISQESVQVLRTGETTGEESWVTISKDMSLTEDEQVKIVFRYELDNSDKGYDLPRYYTLDFNEILKGVAVANGSGNLYEGDLYVGYWSITDGVLTVVVEGKEWYTKDSRGFEVDLTGNIKALGNIAQEGTEQEVGFADSSGSYPKYKVYYDESSLKLSKSVDWETTYDTDGNRTNTYTVTITAVDGMVTLGDISDYFYNNDWQTDPSSLDEDSRVNWPENSETVTITVTGVNTNGATDGDNSVATGLVYVDTSGQTSPLTSGTTLTNGFSDLSGLILYKGQSITIQYTVAVPEGAYTDGNNYYNNITVEYTNNQESEGSASAQCQVLYTKPYVSKSGAVVSSAEGDSNYDNAYATAGGSGTAIKWTITVNMGDFSITDPDSFSSVWTSISDEISNGGGGYLVGSGSSGGSTGDGSVLYPTTSGDPGSETYTISLEGLTWTSSDNGKTWTLTYYTPLDTENMSKVTGTTVTNSITLTSESYETISGSGSATYTPSITAPTITKSCNGKNATASASAAENATSEGGSVSVVDWTIVISDIDSNFTSLTLTESPQSNTDWSTGSEKKSDQTITGITVAVGGNTWTFDLSGSGSQSGGGGGGSTAITGTLTEDSTDYDSSAEPPSGGTGTITYTPPTGNSSSGTLTFSTEWLEAYITAENPAENIITITVTTEIDDAWAGYTYYNNATVDYGFAAEDDGDPDTGSRSANATYRESESKGVTKTGTQTGTNRIHYQVDVDLQDIMEVDADGKADNVGESYTFIFTDDLPAGLTLDESTLDASFCGNGYYPTCDHVGTTTFWTSAVEKKVTLEITANESGSDASGEYNTIIFTVTISGDVKDFMEANGAASEWSPTAALTLSYDVVISDEDALNKANKNANRTTEVQYTNTVSVSYYTDSADGQTSVGDKAVDSQLYTVTDNRVTKCIANTDPDASLIEGADYSIYTAPYARYTVTLNPDGLKLCEGEATTYTATDVLGSDLEFVDVSDTSSSLSEHQKEELRPVFTVDGVEYSGITYTYNQSENKVVFSDIPDGTAVTITYWVKVLVTDYDTELSTFNVGNTFSIGGEDGNASDSYDISSDYTYALEAESSAWSATRSIKLYKFWVDETGATKSLAGSTFEVYSATYANGVITKSETPYVSGITVGEDGVATIGGLYDNVLYVLYEVSSDTGYARRSDPYYFVVGDTDINSENWPTGTHLWTDNTNHDNYDYDYENVKAGTLTLIKEIVSSEPLSGNLRELAENINFAVYITSDSTSTGSDSGSGSGSGTGDTGDGGNWSESGSAPDYGTEGILVGEYNVAADFTYGGVTITNASGEVVSDTGGSTGGSTGGNTGNDETPYTYTYTFTKTLDDLVPGTYKVVETASGSEVYEIKSAEYTYTVPGDNSDSSGTGGDTQDGNNPSTPEEGENTLNCTAGESDGITVLEATSEYPLGTEVTFANTYEEVSTSDDSGDTGNTIGELVITKTISGDAVSEEELEGALQFTVTRTSGTGTDAAQGKDEWTFTLADFTKVEGTADSDENVNATYTLTIKDVPNENTYTVRETLYDVKGYSCEVTYAISGQSNDAGNTGQGGDDNNTYGRITQDINGQYAVANIVSGATTNVNITDTYTKSPTAGVLKITKTIGGVGTAVTEAELEGALTFTVTNRSTNTAETYTLADFTKVTDKNGNTVYDENGNKNSGIDESAAGVYELELPEEPGGYRVEETLYDLDGYACTVSYTTETVTGSETRTNNNWGSSAPTVIIDSASTTATVNITDDYVENGTLVIQKTIKGPVTYDEYKGALQFTVTNNDTKESDTYTIEKDFRELTKATGEVTYVKELDLTPGGYTVEETVWQLENYVGSVSYVVDGESKGSQNASVKVESKSENTEGTTVAITDEYAVETFASELNKGTLLITKTIEGDVTEEELKEGSLTFEVTKDGTPVEGSPFTLSDFTEVIPLKYYTKELDAYLGTYHVVEKLKTPEGYTVSTSYTVTGTVEDGTETSESSENREKGIDAVFAADRSSGVKVDITNSYTEIKEAEAEAEAEESTDIVVEQKGDLLITKTIEGEVTAEELAGALVFTVTNESGSIAGTYTLEDFERTEDGRYEKTLTLVPGGYTVTESMYSVDGFVGSVTYNVGEEEEEGKEPGATEVLGGETAEAQIRDDYTEIPEDYGKLLIEKSIEGPVTDEDVAGALVFNITRNETGESKSYTLKDFVKTGDSRYTLELAAIAGGYTVRETEYGVDGYSCTVSYQAGAVDADGVEADALAEDTGANVTVTAGGTGTVLIQNAYTAQAVMSSNDNKTQDKNTKAQAKTTKKVTKSAKTETATASASDTVSTGDATPIRLLVTVMVVCAAGIAAVLIYRKKRVVPARYKGKWEKNSR